MFQPNMHNRLENRKWREADQLVKLGRTRFYGKTTLNEWSEGDPRISSPTLQPMGHAASLPRRLGIQYKGNCTSTLSSAEAPYGNVHPYGQSSTAARKRPLRRREDFFCHLTRHCFAKPYSETDFSYLLRGRPITGVSIIKGIIGQGKDTTIT